MARAIFFFSVQRREMLSNLSTLDPNFITLVRVQPVGTKAKLYNWSKKKMNDSGYLSKDVRWYCLVAPYLTKVQILVLHLVISLNPRHQNRFFLPPHLHLTCARTPFWRNLRVLFVISRNLRTWTLIDGNESLGTESANYSAQWSLTSIFFYLCFHTAIEFVSTLLLWFLPPPPLKMEFASTIWDCA